MGRGMDGGPGNAGVGAQEGGELGKVWDEEAGLGSCRGATCWLQNPRMGGSFLAATEGRSRWSRGEVSPLRVGLAVGGVCVCPFPSSAGNG